MLIRGSPVMQTLPHTSTHLFNCHGDKQLQHKVACGQETNTMFIARPRHPNLGLVMCLCPMIA